jgi:cytochrome c553
MKIGKTFAFILVTSGLILLSSSMVNAWSPTQKTIPGLSRDKLLNSSAMSAWIPTPVADDPLVRMPGTQPGQVELEGPNRCLNCHSGYDPLVEPGFSWKGSMMAQAGRDFLFLSCVTVAGQDSIWAIGSPNAIDICERCHYPEGWLEGRSDPPNISAMSGSDYDGVECSFCHQMYDPFFETNDSNTPSMTAAEATYLEDSLSAQDIILFNGDPFFGIDNLPVSPGYVENGGGQYYVSPSKDKRAPFADVDPRSHTFYYSRYHKSKYFCSTCHDVSNPVLANLDQDGTQPLNTEFFSAYSYFHVERTFSEFMLSDYGLQGGALGIGTFAPEVFDTSLANNYIARCQDCHMRDVEGPGCNKQGVLIRPTESIEHPNSGLPLHDLSGGNAWVSYVLASAIGGSPNYDATNDQLLNQGPEILTLDLTQGQGIDPEALLAGVERAKGQLQGAASIKNLEYNSEDGTISFRIQNQTGHKLISGFPEGRRMFVNIKAKTTDGSLIYEVNPYDYQAGTLKGLNYDYQPDPNGILPLPQDINPLNEAYVDELVYEVHPSSDLTGEDETFHFALATDRYKDNRIPPKGFRIEDAAERLIQPVWHGVPDPDYFSPDEYAGGYDEVSLTILAEADLVEVNLYYQTTSREYIEFLRDEINGDASTLPDPSAYIIQTDPFFAQLKAWGDTMWQLWSHNMEVPGADPFLMTQASIAGDNDEEVYLPIILGSTSTIGGDDPIGYSNWLVRFLGWFKNFR